LDDFTTSTALSDRNQGVSLFTNLGALKFSTHASAAFSIYGKQNKRACFLINQKID
jgi:hypothetical protein